MIESEEESQVDVVDVLIEMIFLQNGSLFSFLEVVLRCHFFWGLLGEIVIKHILELCFPYNLVRHQLSIYLFEQTPQVLVASDVLSFSDL